MERCVSCGRPGEPPMMKTIGFFDWDLFPPYQEEPVCLSCQDMLMLTHALHMIRLADRKRRL